MNELILYCLLKILSIQINLLFSPSICFTSTDTEWPVVNQIDWNAVLVSLLLIYTLLKLLRDIPFNLSEEYYSEKDPSFFYLKLSIIQRTVDTLWTPAPLFRHSLGKSCHHECATVCMGPKLVFVDGAVPRCSAQQLRFANCCRESVTRCSAAQRRPAKGDSSLLHWIVACGLEKN